MDKWPMFEYEKPVDCTRPYYDEVLAVLSTTSRNDDVRAFAGGVCLNTLIEHAAESDTLRLAACYRVRNLGNHKTPVFGCGVCRRLIESDVVIR